MSRRLGETLVAAGKITEAQLHRALTAQLVFGGHLGTSLVELGYLDEETLGETLASMFGVPYADFDMLSRVPYAVVRALPAKLVEKHKVVPLRLEGKTLQLAMIDPKNILALDEIAFVTGYRIVPWVAPEVRVLQVLEKYYNLQRTQRYVVLVRELSRLSSRRERLRPLETHEVSMDSEGRPQRSWARAAATASGTVGVVAAAQGVADTVVDHWEKYGYGRSWREVAESIDPESAETEPGGEDLRGDEVDTRPQPRTSKMPAPQVEPSAPPASLLEVSRRLAAAESVDEIVSTTLSYAAGRLHRSIFFVTKGATAQGWAGRGPDLGEPAVKALTVTLASKTASIFSLVGPEAPCYLGSVPSDQEMVRFYQRLAVPVPRTVLIVPIRVHGRLAAYLYADGGDRDILAIDLPSVLAVCARAGLALQIILLRNKILSN